MDEEITKINNNNTNNNNDNDHLDNNEVSNNNKSKSKKKTKLYSDAFPKIEKKVKITQLSNIHDIIIKTNFQFNINDIYFRELKLEDINELILLHKEWLPINYDENFFKRSIVDKRDREIYNLGACVKIRDIEYIVGSILCEIKKENIGRDYAPFELCSKTCFESCFCRTLELCYIMTIGVIDECRRIGLASKLLNEFNKLILSQRPRCKGIFLHVIDYNQVATKFYHKNGFKEVNVIKNYYTIMDEIYDGRVLFKTFDKSSENDDSNSNNSSGGILYKIINAVIITPLKFIFCCSNKRKTN